MTILLGVSDTTPPKFQWVIIRTTDGRQIATNATWSTGMVNLTTDFSKFFDDKLCDTALFLTRWLGGTITTEGLSLGECSEGKMN